MTDGKWPRPPSESPYRLPLSVLAQTLDEVMAYQVILKFHPKGLVQEWHPSRPQAPTFRNLRPFPYVDHEIADIAKYIYYKHVVFSVSTNGSTLDAAQFPPPNVSEHIRHLDINLSTWYLCSCTGPAGLGRPSKPGEWADPVWGFFFNLKDRQEEHSNSSRGSDGATSRLALQSSLSKLLYLDLRFELELHTLIFNCSDNHLDANITAFKRQFENLDLVLPPLTKEVRLCFSVRHHRRIERYCRCIYRVVGAIVGAMRRTHVVEVGEDSMPVVKASRSVRVRVKNTDLLDQAYLEMMLVRA